MLIRCHRFIEILCRALVADQKTRQHYSEEMKTRELMSVFHGMSLLLANERRVRLSVTASPPTLRKGIIDLSDITQQ